MMFCCTNSLVRMIKYSPLQLCWCHLQVYWLHQGHHSLPEGSFQHLVCHLLQLASFSIGWVHTKKKTTCLLEQLKWQHLSIRLLFVTMPQRPFCNSLSSQSWDGDKNKAHVRYLSFVLLFPGVYCPPTWKGFCCSLTEVIGWSTTAKWTRKLQILIVNQMCKFLTL